MLLDTPDMSFRQYYWLAKSTWILKKDLSWAFTIIPIWNPMSSLNMALPSTHIDRSIITLDLPSRVYGLEFPHGQKEVTTWSPIVNTFTVKVLDRFLAIGSPGNVYPSAEPSQVLAPTS